MPPRPEPIARVLERGFAAMLRGYERSLEWVLRHPRFTLGVTVLTIALTGYLFYVIPKGFFPIEDTGYIIGGTETAEDTSFAGMVEKQLEDRCHHSGQSLRRVLQQRGRPRWEPDWE